MIPEIEVRYVLSILKDQYGAEEVFQTRRLWNVNQDKVMFRSRRWPLGIGFKFYMTLEAHKLLIELILRAPSRKPLERRALQARLQRSSSPA